MANSDNLYIELVNLVFLMLKMNCPIMSGNMSEFISIEDVGEDYTTISVSGPSYDIPLWEKSRQIRHTGRYDYAAEVNAYGGFRSGNKSKHWANRAVFQACQEKAGQYGGKVELNVKL